LSSRSCRQASTASDDAPAPTSPRRPPGRDSARDRRCDPPRARSSCGSDRRRQRFAGTSRHAPGHARSPHAHRSITRRLHAAAPRAARHPSTTHSAAAADRDTPSLAPHRATTCRSPTAPRPAPAALPITRIDPPRPPPFRRSQTRHPNDGGAPTHGDRHRFWSSRRCA
jgi:hypothetical protein